MNESETIMFISLKLKANPPATVPSGRGGGGYTPSYKLCTYALPQTVPFRSVVHFAVESGMGECLKIFVLLIPDE